ncbi:MAG: hypothetical protein K2Y51_25740, partial [Gammaproteobacteria bacterium]|nr:hypothetical protein [Gammaproteobacteria bacterium]
MAGAGYVERGLRALALVMLLFCALCASPRAAEAPRVESFTPQGTVKAPRQVSVRFSADMVAFGESRQPAPFDVECPAAGRGRWLDARQWVYDFDAPLPAGLRCRFTLAAALVTHDGVAFDAQPVFVFDTGGPGIRRSLPAEGDTGIDAEQHFILALEAPAEVASIAAHASCAVNELAERIPVDVLDGEARAQVLAQRRALGYQYFAVLWKSGEESIEKVRRDDLAQAEEALVVLRCRRALPADSDVRLVWGAGITSVSGLATSEPQVLAFHTRPEFSVRVECERVNPQSECLPLRPLRVLFSAPVPIARATEVKLVDDHGRPYRALPFAPGAASVEALEFAAPFPEHAALSLRLPDTLQDDAGRAPENAERFPLTVKFDGYPPLAKFSGEFGILEAGAGGVLPVTVRKVETALPGQKLAQPVLAQSLRVTDSAALVDWLRRVKQAMAPAGEWLKNDAGESVWRENTGAKSVFADTERARLEAFTLPNPDGDHAFQVLGIPLGKPGFYVVELESPALGAALLGRREARYVATAALVTNLAVHLQWGRESSQVWVTRLDDATPVADAEVEIADGCSGAVRWKGRTDAQGLAHVAESLGEPHGNDYCESWAQPPLLASARVGDDMSFTLSHWQQGISPHDFGLPVAYGSSATVAHTVLDRTLFRAGETVSMKHFLRRHVAAGLALAPSEEKPVQAVVTHLGSNEKVEVPLSFDAQGVALSEWAVPAAARLGDYEVALVREADDASRLYAVTARFRVEQFRVPTMRAVVQGPRRPQVQPASVPLALHVGYLAGGSAGGLPVTLRTQVEPRTVSFKHYQDFTFGGKDVVAGPEAPQEDESDAFAWYLREYGAYRDREGHQSAASVATRALTLDEQGAARVEVDSLPRASAARTLVAELEYQDSNGERLASTTRVALWPAALALGMKVEGWAGTRDKLRFQVVALDLDGKPVAGRRVRVDFFQRERQSYRKRLIGGFYAFESSSTVKPLATRCDGATDRHGQLSCEVAPSASGELLLRARAEDADGNVAIASTTAWVAGDEDWWFKPGNADRIDILPEQKEYAADGVARFQVRSPFRHATALVTVAREGVLRSFVTELDGHEPVIEVPLEARDAPNVYVSVLALRGRVGWWQAALGTAVRYLKLPFQVDGALPTALVDLGKPAYRYGVARIAVGWQPHRLEVDVKPAREVYQVRDTAHVELEVRAADGSALPPDAEVALAAVDEGLLELANNDTWDLLRAMMGERGLEFWTSTAQMQVVGKRHFGRKAVPHGGGGGRGAAARERFDTLLLWRGRVGLDDAGHASVDVPLNDALTAFRIVAVAHAGVARFGTGQATIRTSQDLMLHAGLAPLVREGDRYQASFTLRNVTDAAMPVTARARVTPQGGDAAPLELAPITLTLAPGAAQDITWAMTAPDGATSLAWDVEAAADGGAAQDRLTARQQVEPLWPVRTQQATLAQLAPALSLPLAPPTGALSGRGGVEVALRARLGDGLSGVREYMGDYDYACYEQSLSRAIALRDATLWQAAMTRLPDHLDGDGLLRYFPSDWLAGSDTLTSYVLTIAHEAGWEIPAAPRMRMLEALKRFVNGELTRDSVLPTTDLMLRKVAALAALARHGEAQPNMFASLSLDPARWPTSGLLDLLDLVRHLPEPASELPSRAALEGLLRARLEASGTTLRFATEREDALWWLMISPDVNAARTVLETLHADAWRADAPRLARGLLERQRSGHWNTTVANAWGVLALEQFSAAFETTPVSGATALGVGAEERTVTWADDAVPAPVTLPWPASDAPLRAEHRGAGRP